MAWIPLAAAAKLTGLTPDQVLEALTVRELEYIVLRERIMVRREDVELLPTRKEQNEADR